MSTKAGAGIMVVGRRVYGQTGPPFIKVWRWSWDGCAGPPMGGMMMGASTRRGISDIAWHPDNVRYPFSRSFGISLTNLRLCLLTSSEDDTYPTILSWDLHNARAPEKIFALSPQQLNTFTQNTLPRGHTKVTIFQPIIGV